MITEDNGSGGQGITMPKIWVWLLDAAAWVFVCGFIAGIAFGLLHYGLPWLLGPKKVPLELTALTAEQRETLDVLRDIDAEGFTEEPIEFGYPFLADVDFEELSHFSHHTRTYYPLLSPLDYSGDPLQVKEQSPFLAYFIESFKIAMSAQTQCAYCSGPNAAPICSDVDPNTVKSWCEYAASLKWYSNHPLEDAVRRLRELARLKAKSEGPVVSPPSEYYIGSDGDIELTPEQRMNIRDLERLKRVSYKTPPIDLKPFYGKDLTAYSRYEDLATWRYLEWYTAELAHGDYGDYAPPEVRAVFRSHMMVMDAYLLCKQCAGNDVNVDSCKDEKVEKVRKACAAGSNGVQYSEYPMKDVLGVLRAQKMD